MIASHDCHVTVFAVVEVGFESPDYSIVESEGEVLVCARLTGSLDIPVSVVFSVHDPAGRDQGN